MTNFAQTMRDWQRMCKYYDDHYDCTCCNYCPLKNCGAIWEMDDTTDWEKIEKSIDAWAAEHPEPKYPTWREYLKAIGLTTSKNIYFSNENDAGVRIYDALNEKADSSIPTEIAEKLGLKPQY